MLAKFAKSLIPYSHRHTDMKLEPTAKPIRIRIKLGNSEYSSWDSVKKSNFSIKELYPLFKDGRLERWLEQIGEEQDAHRTGELSKQCGDGNMKDYILFLSLIFDEVADSLSAYKGKEWSLNDYLSSTPLDTIKFIYAQTMDVEEIDWGEEFTKLVTNEEKYKDLFTYLERLSRNNPQPERCRQIISTFYSNCSKKGYQWASAFKDQMLSIDYVEYIYQNECFQIPDVNWGEEFAKLVTDVDKYKRIFTYLERFARNNPRSERCKKILSSFYSYCYKKGYQWASAFKNELSLDYIAYIYQNDCFQIPDIDWGILFADCVKDWATDSEKIEKIIKRNHKKSFYNHCAENGFEEVKKKLDPCSEMIEEAQEVAKISDLVKKNTDSAKKTFVKLIEEVDLLRYKENPWNVLANSDEYENIIMAINKCSLFRSGYNRDDYNYNNLKLSLGKQILDFLQSLRDHYWDDNSYDDSDYYLEDAKQVMIYVDQRGKDDSGWFFYNVQKEELETMWKRGVEIASYALDFFYKDYDEIAIHVLDKIIEKLSSQRLK